MLFLVRDQLSRGELKLIINNDNGYLQDAASVNWTIFSNSGNQVSGKNLPAIRQTVGIYYAPWFTNVPNGNYTCIWSVVKEFGNKPIEFTEYLFVVDPSSYQCLPIKKNAISVPGQFTFLSGQSLGPGDLPLYLKNNSGLLQNASCVFFSIVDKHNRCIYPRTIASSLSTGVYYASFLISACSGNYEIIWEWQSSPSIPFKSTRMGFSVINPVIPDPNFVNTYCCKI